MALGLERFRVGALSGRLDLNEADKGAFTGHRIVGPGHQIGQLRLANQICVMSRQAKQRRKILDQRLQWRAQLILRLAGDRRIAELGLGGRAKFRNDFG